MAPTNEGFEICFSGRSQVEVQGRGQVDMKDLKIGDLVLVENNKFEPVYSFGHINHSTETEYLQIFTQSSRHPLEMSSDHMVFVEGRRSVPASSVQVGDKLIVGTDSHTLTKVVTIKEIVRRGMYAPFTKSGTIVVNGILASCFVSFQGKEYLHIGDVATPLSYHWLAHTIISLQRWLVSAI
mmetsp:Transcript_2264/g.5289  ORF Transcript_2264/g.5289 Transcript_2264/m.5289 type:complete len:182 (-) Transcript_2264:9-554(-)